MTREDHPPADRLAAFDAGLLPAAEREAVERHVAGCPFCCAVLERLPEDALVARIRAFAGRSTAVAAETSASGRTAEPPADIAEELREHARYRLLDLLGTGGMGTVYRAVQTNLDRVVALKVLNRPLTDRPGFAVRFQAEVKALARLNHPNVVAAYDADRAGEQHFLVMEFVKGESLEAVVTRRGPLPTPEAFGLARQAAVGLQHAHEHGLVHRDIKPANLLLTPDGVVKVADFGLARLVETGEPAEPGSAPMVVGTPEYMAPEQAREPNRADIRSDLYALGGTLHFLLTGRPPFVGQSRLQTLLDHQDAEPPPVAGLSHEAATVLARLLAKDPAARFATPAAAADALALGAGAPEVAAPRPSKSRRRWAGGVGGAVAVAAVVGAVAVFGPNERRTEPGPAAPLAEPEGVEVAPAPRPVDRPPLAPPDQLAAMRKQAAAQAVEWVRANNRWNPDAKIAVDAAARVETGRAKADGFLLTFGSGLVRSGKPTLLSARTGSFFVFELTPEQAQAANLGPMSHVFTAHNHATDERRSAPAVRLSDFHVQSADAHPSGARIDGSVVCEFASAPRAGDYLRVTHYAPDGRRVMFLHHPKPPPPAGRTVLQFSANPLEPRTGKSDRLVLVFADWVSERDAVRVVESNTAAAILLIRVP